MEEEQGLLCAVVRFEMYFSAIVRLTGCAQQLTGLRRFSTEAKDLAQSCTCAPQRRIRNGVLLWKYSV